MLRSSALIAVSLCLAVPINSLAAELRGGYLVTYSGGSLPDLHGGDSLKLHIASDGVTLSRKGHRVVLIRARAITEVSYGQEVHRRVGTAAALAVISLGVGAIVAFSKSKKHYIGIIWSDGENKGGIALQADKNEYRGLLAGLEGVSGLTAVDTDVPQSSARANAASTNPLAPVATQAAPTAPPVGPLTSQTSPPLPVVPTAEPPAPVIAAVSRPALIDPPQGITVRFTSVPTNAELDIDGEYWGTTPTADLSWLAAGAHTIAVRRIGYESWARKITLSPGENRTIHAELQPNDASKPRVSGTN